MHLMSESPPPSGPISIRELKRQAGQSAISAGVWVQVEAVQEKE